MLPRFTRTCPPLCCKRGNMFCFGGVEVGTVHLEHLWVYVKTFLEHTLFQREFSVPCESLTLECFASEDWWQTGMKEVTDDTFGSLRHLLYSFPPPHQKRNAVYQSYYIHINGQTRAGNQFVVNKFSNQVLLFNCPFVVGFLYCRNKCRWAGHHSSGTKPN